VRLLLDTHLLLWALGAPSRLPAALRQDLDRAEVYVSAASIWEIAIKSALRKLDADPLEVLDAAVATGFSPLDVTARHAALVSTLAPHHRDPFDRLLVAQASSEPLILITNDRALAPYGDFVRLLD
jgi:PIN domain nuclease of toxin-antitoxin system